MILFGLGAVQINFQKDPKKPLISVSDELKAALGPYRRWNCRMVKLRPAMNAVGFDPIFWFEGLKINKERP